MESTRWKNQKGKEEHKNRSGMEMVQGMKR